MATNFGNEYFTASFTDVLQLPEFKGLTEYDLLPRKLDSRVVPYFYPVGADIDHQVVVQACKHRSNTKGIVVGYRYVLPYRKDKAWLNDSLCTTRCRIAAQPDADIAFDMLKMSAEGMPYNKFVEMCWKAGKMSGTVGVSRSKWEESYKEDLDKMKELQKKQIEVRGALINDECCVNPVK